MKTNHVMRSVLMATLSLALALGAWAGMPVQRVAAEPISLSAPYTQNFDSLANTGTDNAWVDDTIGQSHLNCQDAEQTIRIPASHQASIFDTYRALGFLV